MLYAPIKIAPSKIYDVLDKNDTKNLIDKLLQNHSFVIVGFRPPKLDEYYISRDLCLMKASYSEYSIPFFILEKLQGMTYNITQAWE